MLARGIRNNNPGNLRSNSFVGVLADDDPDGFARYRTMHFGVRALCKQLLIYQQRGIKTVNDLMAIYAPESENNTKKYAAFVATRLGVACDESIDISHRLFDLTRAIIDYECGKDAAFVMNVTIDAAIVDARHV